MSRIAVIGAGAVGAYYGARLAEAGHDVHFLMRADYDAVSARGLRINSSFLGDINLERPQIARSSAEIGPVDWVVCALKATAIEEARDLVMPCVSEHTRILVAMNGLGLDERFAEWFGGKHVFGGITHGGLIRPEAGVVLDVTGSAQMGMSHFEDDPSEVDLGMALWSDAKVRTYRGDCLLEVRWRKLLANLTFNGMTVVAGGVPVGRLFASPGLRDACEAVMREAAAIANADLEAHDRAPRFDVESAVSGTMGGWGSAGMAEYLPSTTVDFLAGLPLEVDAIFGEPLRRARALGVATPYLALMTAQLESLNTPDVAARRRS